MDWKLASPGKACSLSINSSLTRSVASWWHCHYCQFLTRLHPVLMEPWGHWAKLLIPRTSASGWWDGVKICCMWRTQTRSPCALPGSKIRVDRWAIPIARVIKGDDLEDCVSFSYRKRKITFCEPWRIQRTPRAAVSPHSHSMYLCGAILCPREQQHHSWMLLTDANVGMSPHPASTVSNLISYTERSVMPLGSPALFCSAELGDTLILSCCQ